jgi:RHS repeat-associated protein
MRALSGLVGVRPFAIVTAILVVVTLLVAGAPVVEAQSEGPEVFEPPAANREAVGVSADELPAVEPTERPVPVEEVVAERTERSKTWLMSDGTTARQIVTAPLHVMDSSGGWVDVDTTLVEQPDGSFVTGALPVTVTLPDTAAGAVRVADATSAVSFELLGSIDDAASGDASAAAAGPGHAAAPSSAGGVAGGVELPAVAAAGVLRAADAVSYAGVAVGVELVYEPFVGGVKETAVLAAPGSPRTLVFAIAGEGLSAVADESGVRLVDAGGVSRWVIAPPFMTDAVGARSEGVAISVDGQGRLVQTITDTAWIEDPARVWPVSVDPTVSSTAIITDCQLHEDAPALTDCASATGVVGDDGTGEHRMVYAFDVHAAFDEPVQVINDAWLGLRRTTANPGSATSQIDVHGLTEPFDPADVSWDDRTATTAWGTAGGDLLWPREYATVPGGGAGELVGLSIDRLVQGWLDGADNNGIAVISGGSSYYRFHTAEAASSADWPALWVTFNPLFGVKDQYGLESFQLSDRRTAHVNIASGNLTVSELDVDLVARAGFSAQVIRQYDSRFQSRTPGFGGDDYGAWINAGWGWQVNPSDGVTLEQGPAGDRFLVAGAQYHFPYDSSTGGWHSPEGSGMTLTPIGSGAAELSFDRTGEVWTFAGNGYLSDKTDRHGNTITYSYDYSGFPRIASMTDSRGQVTTFDFSSNGWNQDLTSYTDPFSRTHSVTYTSNNEIASYTDPDNNTTTYTYNSTSNSHTSPHDLTSITDAEGNITTFGYDNQGRVDTLTRVTNTANLTGPTWLFDYTTPWQTVVTDPNGHDTTYDFDRQGRITDVTDPLNRSRSIEWRASAQVGSFTDLAGAQTINSYSADALGNLESVELPSGAQTSFAYTDQDNLYAPSAVTSTTGHTTQIDYDALGRPETVTDPTSDCNSAGCTQVIAYTADGSIDTVTDPNGHVTDYTYNSDGELIEIDYPTPRADVTFGYDSIGRPTSVTDGNTITTTYTYDLAGNLTSLTDPAGTVAYGYNDANEVTSVTEPGNHVTTISYHTNGTIDVITYPNGWTLDSDTDTSGRPEQITATDGTTTAFDRLYDYTHSATDTALLHEETEVTTGEVTVYTYDEVERLTGAYSTTGGLGSGLHHYTYDPAGNRLTHNDNGTTTNFGYDDANELTYAGAVTVTHDSAGNQTATSAGDAYSYDDANRPTTITAGGVGPLSATYAGHNAVERPALGATTAVTSILGVTSETTGTTIIGYTRLPNGQVIGRRDPANTTRHYLHTDRLGSVLAMTNQAGTLTTRYDYTPYGQTTVTSLGSGHVNQPYRYTGQHQDPTGLYKMGLRYYNPNQARWTQPDPALTLSQLAFANTYLYVRSNPANLVDPTGAFDVFSPYVGLAVGACGYFSTYCGYAALIYAGAAAGDYWYDNNCTDFGVRDQPQCDPA